MLGAFLEFFMIKMENTVLDFVEDVISILTLER